MWYSSYPKKVEAKEHRALGTYTDSALCWVDQWDDLTHLVNSGQQTLGKICCPIDCCRVILSKNVEVQQTNFKIKRTLNSWRSWIFSQIDSAAVVGTTTPS